MNKKLFLAGVALLAAVGFTSCNSDTPIDSSNPSGVTPAAVRHEVGGSYDWTAIVTDYAELQKFWSEDKAAVAKLLKDNKAKTANILIDVTGYTLKAGDVITLPDFWGDGATQGKVVNITFDGNFKNADYQRADAIKNGAAATKLPVVINTNTLKGGEVNFTFNVEKFDLELTTDLTRSTFAGDYTIGYLKAVAAQKLSATEFNEGTVEGLDIESTGDFKGEIAGVWVKNIPAATIEVTDKGIKVGDLKDYTVFGKNVFVEANTELDTWYKNGAGNDAQFTLGTVKFVKGANLYLVGTKKDGVTAAVDAIESIQGFDKDKCLVVTQGIGKDFSKIDAVEKVTVYGGTTGKTITLEKDIFTDVEFNDPIIYDASVLPTIDNVEFDQALEIVVPEDNIALSFNNVKFDLAPVTITSGKEIENTVATTATTTYQWIVSDAAANKGYYEKCKNDLSDLRADNVGQEVKEYSYVKGKEKLTFVSTGAGDGSFTGDDAKEASKYRIVKINVTTPAGKITLIPEGTTVTMDKDCKFVGATTDAALNIMWGNKELWDEQCWYSVNYAGNDYVWKKATDTTGTSSSGVWFVLVKK